MRRDFLCLRCEARTSLDTFALLVLLSHSTPTCSFSFFSNLCCCLGECVCVFQVLRGVSLQVFGALERNMLPQEKVADAIYKWEKYGRKTKSPAELRLTFKKRLFLGPLTVRGRSLLVALGKEGGSEGGRLARCSRYSTANN